MADPKPNDPRFDEALAMLSQAARGAPSARALKDGLAAEGIWKPIYEGLADRSIWEPIHKVLGGNGKENGLCAVMIRDVAVVVAAIKLAEADAGVSLDAVRDAIDGILGAAKAVDRQLRAWNSGEDPIRRRARLRIEEAALAIAVNRILGPPSGSKPVRGAQFDPIRERQRLLGTLALGSRVRRGFERGQRAVGQRPVSDLADVLRVLPCRQDPRLLQATRDVEDGLLGDGGLSALFVEAAQVALKSIPKGANRRSDPPASWIAAAGAYELLKAWRPELKSSKLIMPLSELVAALDAAAHSDLCKDTGDDGYPLIPGKMPSPEEDMGMEDEKGNDKTKEHHYPKVIAYVVARYRDEGRVARVFDGVVSREQRAADVEQEWLAKLKKANQYDQGDDGSDGITRYSYEQIADALLSEMMTDEEKQLPVESMRTKRLSLTELIALAPDQQHVRSVEVAARCCGSPEEPIECFWAEGMKAWVILGGQPLLDGSPSRGCIACDFHGPGSESLAAAERILAAES